jgi:hypothetical protein
MYRKVYKLIPLIFYIRVYYYKKSHKPSVGSYVIPLYRVMIKPDALLGD